MAFVNEYISEEDRKKYRIDEINKKIIGSPSRDWTIDRERDIYLRQVGQGREEFLYQVHFTFYWKGRLLWISLDKSDDANPIPGAYRKKLVELSEIGSGINILPSDLAPHKPEIIANLIEALEASKGGVGIFATPDDKPYPVTLQIAKGV